jgi:hypothetical protein
MGIGRTVGSGHFSPLEVPDQINRILERFLSSIADHRRPGRDPR